MEKTFEEIMNDIVYVREHGHFILGHKRERRISGIRVFDMDNNVYHVLYDDGNEYRVDCSTEEVEILHEYPSSHVGETRIEDFISVILRSERHRDFASFVMRYLEGIQFDEKEIGVSRVEYFFILQSWFIGDSAHTIASRFDMTEEQVYKCIRYFHSMKWDVYAPQGFSPTYADKLTEDIRNHCS